MKKVFLFIVLGALSAVAQADSLNFSFSGLVGLTEDMSRIFITPTADGKLQIRSVDGEEVVEATVISDDRPLDGDLVLNLGKKRKMTVTSGFSIDGKIYYYLEVGTKKIELNPIVFLETKKK